MNKIQININHKINIETIKQIIYHFLIRKLNLKAFSIILQSYLIKRHLLHIFCTSFLIKMNKYQISKN